MECNINEYSFSLNDNNTISVFIKNGINVATVIKPDITIETQKQFEQECSYWYFTQC